MRLWAQAVVTQDLRLHCLAAKSRPEEDGPRFVPLQGIPAAKGCSRPLANEMRQQILLWLQGLQVAILLLADLHASLDPMPKMLQPRLGLDSIKLGPAQLSQL